MVTADEHIEMAAWTDRPRPFGHFRALPELQAGGDEVLRPPGVVDGRDQAVPDAGQLAGAADDLQEVSMSRLALMRRTAALSVQMRSASVSIRSRNSAALSLTGLSFACRVVRSAPVRGGARYPPLT